MSLLSQHDIFLINQNSSNLQKCPKDSLQVQHMALCSRGSTISESQKPNTKARREVCWVWRHLCELQASPNIPLSFTPSPSPGLQFVTSASRQLWQEEHLVSLIHCLGRWKVSPVKTARPQRLYIPDLSRGRLGNKPLVILIDWRMSITPSGEMGNRIWLQPAKRHATTVSKS